MPGILWYSGVSACGFIVAVCTIYAKRHVYGISTMVVFYIFATSLTWIGEFIVLGLFNSYAYKPGVFGDAWAENLFIHLLLNSTIWPGLAMLASVLPLKTIVLPAFVAFYLMVEYFFLKLRIYEQHWWRYYMTAIIVFVFLCICKKWFHWLVTTHSRLLREVTLYLACLVVIHLPDPILLLMGEQYYKVGFIRNLYPNMIRSSTVFDFAFHMIQAIILVYLACRLGKWYWKLAAFATPTICEIILQKVGILNVLDGWRLIYTIIIYSISAALFLLMEHVFLKPGRISQLPYSN